MGFETAPLLVLHPGSRTLARDASDLVSRFRRILPRVEQSPNHLGLHGVALAISVTSLSDKPLAMPEGIVAVIEPPG